MTNSYETDFVQWLDKQVSFLLKCNYAQLDIINVVEEVKLGNLCNLWKQIIAHKLKLEYSQLITVQKCWQDEIDEFYEQLGLVWTKTLRNTLDLGKIY